MVIFTLREKTFACLLLNCFHLAISRFGEIVVNYPNIGKTLNSIDLVNLMSSISVRFNSFLFFYSIFNERNLADIIGWSVWMDSNHRAHTTLALLLIQARICVPPLFDRFLRFRLVGLDGLEPSTSRLSGARSNHLSYKPFSVADSSHQSRVARLPFVRNPCSCPIGV